MMSFPSFSTVSLMLAILFLSGCSSLNENSAPEATGEVVSDLSPKPKEKIPRYRCKLGEPGFEERLAPYTSDLSSAFERAQSLVDGKRSADELADVASRFLLSQETYTSHVQGLRNGLQQEKITSEEFSRHQFCVAKRVFSTCVLSKQLKQVTPQTDFGHLTTMLNVKYHWLNQSEDCHTKASELPEAFKFTNRKSIGHCLTTHDGFFSGGALTFEVPRESDWEFCQPLSLRVQVFCQKKVDNASYVELEKCQGASFGLNDRMGLRLQASRDISLYLVLLTSEGGLRLLFPSGSKENRILMSDRMTMLEGDFADKGWMSFDDIAEGYLQLLVVASVAPIKELESLRTTSESIGAAPSSIFMKIQGLGSSASRGSSLQPVVSRGGGLGDKLLVGHDVVAQEFFVLLER